MLARIDELVKARTIRTTRHTWLLEAIAKEIDREV
jgi:predicted transcriptional regulator